MLVAVALVAIVVFVANASPVLYKPLRRVRQKEPKKRARPSEFPISEISDLYISNSVIQIRISILQFLNAILLAVLIAEARRDLGNLVVCWNIPDVWSQ